MPNAIANQKKVAMDMHTFKTVSFERVTNIPYNINEIKSYMVCSEEEDWNVHQ